MTLYELTGQWQQLLEWAEDGEVDEQTLTDTLESLEGEIEDKADGYAKVLQQLKADSEAIRAEVDRLTERKRTIESRILRLKESLMTAMQTTGKTKIQTQLFRFHIAKNPEAVVLDKGIEAIPDEYIIQPAPQIDKKAIRAALIAGKDEGLKFEFAHLEQKERVDIK